MHRIGDELRAKIDKAIQDVMTGPGKPVKSTQNRRLLVSSLNKPKGIIKDGHNSIDVSNYAIQRMGEISGAYTAYFSDDPRFLDRENLSLFDALCFNNTAYLLTDNKTWQQNLLSFVREGKGFAGFHAAAATFCQYPEYNFFPDYGKMLGGFENGGHPWGPEETIVLTPEDSKSPLNAAFQGKDFSVKDEVFQMKDHYSRERLRVLLRINLEKSDFSPEKRVLPERRADRDLAISWIRKEEKGRIFYTSLGHNDHLYWNPAILSHKLAGLQYALGDLDADSTPQPL